MNLQWTPQMDADLIALSDKGVSASVIGSKLGKSRNAVLGRLHRKRIAATCDEFGGPNPDEHDRQMKAAEMMARAVQKAKWTASFQKTISERKHGQTEILPALRIAEDGRVIDRHGITMPFISLQWPGYEVIPESEAA